MNWGCDMASGAEGTMAEVMTMGVDGIMGGTAVAAAEKGATVEVLAPDIDTRLLELELLHKW